MVEVYVISRISYRLLNTILEVKKLIHKESTIIVNNFIRIVYNWRMAIRIREIYYPTIYQTNVKHRI
jgi:hypothetical protein